MSYSLNEPEWPPMCECCYDEARNEVFRGNCPLHYKDDPEGPEQVPAARKPPTIQKALKPSPALEARSSERSG